MPETTLGPPPGGTLRRVKVADRSMSPTLLPGDRLRLEPLDPSALAGLRGRVVVVVDPESGGRWLIKRVVGTPGEVPSPGEEPVPDDSVFVVGDNLPESRDSRAFGPVRVSQILGVVTTRYWPMARRGPIAKALP